MSILRRELQNITESMILCKPPGYTCYTDCHLILDHPSQKLICIKADGNSENKKILAEFDIENISLVEAAPKQKQQYCFAVHYFSKITYFGAKSWKEMESWIHAIKDSSQIKVSQSDLNPHRKSISGPYVTEVIGGKVIQHVKQTPPVMNEKEPRLPHDAPTVTRCSSENVSEQIPNAVKTGYCVKQGGVRKNWKRRFLLLTSSQLMYFKHELEKRPLRMIEIQDIKNVKVAEEEGGYTNILHVLTPYRTFHIQFDTRDEMVSWLEEIRKQAELPVMTYL